MKAKADRLAADCLQKKRHRVEETIEECDTWLHYYHTHSLCNLHTAKAITV